MLSINSLRRSRMTLGAQNWRSSAPAFFAKFLPVAALATQEQRHEDAKEMLDFGVVSRLQLLDLVGLTFLNGVRQLLAPALAHGNFPVRRPLQVLWAPVHTDVMHGPFFAVQRRIGSCHVMDVYRFADSRLDQTRFGIQTVVCLYPEVPLVTFLCLGACRRMHRVAAIHRWRRRIGDNAFLQQQKLLSEAGIYRVEDQTRVERVLGTFVRTAIVLLLHVEPRRAHEPKNQTVPRVCRAGCLEYPEQARPRHVRLKIGAEAITARDPLFGSVFQFREGRLHRAASNR